MASRGVQFLEWAGRLVPQGPVVSGKVILGSWWEADGSRSEIGLEADMADTDAGIGSSV